VKRKKREIIHNFETGVDMFQCSICMEIKPISEYYMVKKRGKKDIFYDCKSCCSKRFSEYREKNKERERKRGREYYYKNRDSVNKKTMEWRKTHPEKRRIIDAKTRKRRFRENKNQKILLYIKHRIKCFLFKGVKSKKTENLLGCNPQEFKSYIESKFKDGMSWENYGDKGWHIDHIIPCSAFDLTDTEQQKKCFHYTNTQPLWAIENLKKGFKILHSTDTISTRK
jgi:hypothetical protein